MINSLLILGVTQRYIILFVVDALSVWHACDAVCLHTAPNPLWGPGVQSAIDWRARIVGQQSPRVVWHTLEMLRRVAGARLQRACIHFVPRV